MKPNKKAVELIHQFGNPERLMTILAPCEGLVIGVFKSNHAPCEFDVVSAFTVDKKWHASMDLHSGDAQTMLDTICTRIN